MTDLIKRLRVDEPACEEHFTANLAADRIEKLENSLAWYQMMDAMSSDHVVELTDKLEAAEAKLTKAMAGLRKIADHKHFSLDQGWMQNTEARIASAVLAELEKTE